MRKKADGTWLLFLLVWTTNHTTVVYQLTENDQQELQLNRCCSMDELVTENVILRDVDVALLKDGHTRCALFCGSPYQQFQNNFYNGPNENVYLSNSSLHIRFHIRVF